MKGLLWMAFPYGRKPLLVWLCFAGLFSFQRVIILARYLWVHYRGENYLQQESCTAH